MHQKTFTYSGIEINFSTPKTMGILNLTPNSFYDGGKHNTVQKAMALVDKMVKEGVDILDIGAQSTKPNVAPLPANEELELILPVLENIKKKFPHLPISIDTYYSQVARQCVQNGAHIVNDISAGNIDTAMLATVANLQVPYLAMHMQGTPATMQSHPLYTNVVEEVHTFFTHKIKECRQMGITQMGIDLGFGFGKSQAHNFSLLKNMQGFTAFDLPILAGISRKSMVYKTLGTTAQNALNGTTALHMIALQNGANILRVHDVQEAKEVIQLYKEIKEAP